MMLDYKQPDLTSRIYVLHALVFSGLMVLLLSVFYRQVLQQDHWSSQMAQGSTRTVKLPAPRGKIMDRNGIILVGNRPSYNVALYLEEFGIAKGRKRQLMKAVQQSIEDLTGKMKIPARVDERVVLAHYDQKGPLPLTVWNDLTPASLAAFEERSPWQKGVDLQIEPVRVYPFNSLASHLLGYVGKPESKQQELENMYDSEGRRAFSQPTAIGKAGIELAMESELKGTPGERVILLNAAGFAESELKSEPPKPGHNVALTLDQEIQKIVEESFVGYRGACVILDPRNGDVLAMASFPSYNPNLFIPAIKRSDWQTLTQDEQKPMINRTIQGNYHPGSTFKVIMALAGLEAGVCSAKTSVDCQGSFHLGPIEFNCWKKEGHGIVDLKESLKASCNVFNYTLGQNLGGPPIWTMAEAFGLGRKSGLPLNAESKGLLPSEEWKKKTQKTDMTKWTAGDSVNMAIGQGFLEVTPIQMAVVAATIANGGSVYQPRLVDHIETYEGITLSTFEPKMLNKIPVSEENLQLVRAAMLSVVMEDGGTGRSARHSKYKIAGKTGSAQSPTRDKETGETIKQTTTWMISFAPFEEPRYAMVLVAEAGDSGGHTCGPFAGAIYSKIFQLEQDRKTPRPPPSIAALPVSDKIGGSEGEVSGQIMGVSTNAVPNDSSGSEEESTEPPPVSVPAQKIEIP